MTKVAHFVSFGIGGADRSSLELVRALSQKIPDIQVFYNDMSFPIRTDDQDLNQPLLNIYDEFKAFVPLHKIQNIEELNSFGIDVLHTHRSGEDSWLIPGLDKLKRTFKIVETNFHGFLDTPADFRIYPSLALSKFRKIKINGKNQIVPNIVNSFSGKSLRVELGVSLDKIIYGRVGRSDKSIYSPSLLKSYSKIENSNTVLIWVGVSTQAMDDANRLGIKNIIWKNPISDPHEIANYYATFDVYCHASPLGETFGNTIAEAVLRGVPVASLRGSRKYPQAQKELLEKPQFCNTPRHFTSLLKRYRDNVSIRSNIGIKNKEFGNLNLDSEIIADRVLNIYQSVIHD